MFPVLGTPNNNTVKYYQKYIITDKFGEEITTDSQGSVIASANEKLHTEIISLINEEN